MKYSDQITDWLVELGYTHCFFVAGGNIMHLLESASHKFKCVAFIHEVAAGIAAEYFNEVSHSGRSFVLVTAGPGLTNIITAMAGAYLESRELLVLGGQVKTADLSRKRIRQRGIQEIDGVDISAPITVESILLEDVRDRSAFTALAEAGSHGRKGPVFIEIPLDVQGRDVDQATLSQSPIWTSNNDSNNERSTNELDRLASALKNAERPVILLGGGVSRATMQAIRPQIVDMGVPVMTTWNGFDRVAADDPLYFGRPNTWGQRYANLIMQQSDLLLALGTRLGLQQTGFNWQQFLPVGKVVQVDCDEAELEKGHPRVDWPILGDANMVLRHIAKADLGRHDPWVAYCREIKQALPLNEPVNETRPGYLSPYEFCLMLSDHCNANDIVIPCSSGGAFTVMMQTFQQKAGQIIVSNKGLAAMGYGLSGAIGAALAGDRRRTILVEGDGGFAQNLQEIGTAAINGLNLKIFIFDDRGYASIRMTQRSYFGGKYIGCDRSTGLGLPSWEKLFAAYDVPAMRLEPGYQQDAFHNAFNAQGPAAFIVSIDPQQTYFPKIASRVAENGGMVSNPLHMMSPFLDETTMQKIGRYIVARDSAAQ